MRLVLVSLLVVAASSCGESAPGATPAASAPAPPEAPAPAVPPTPPLAPPPPSIDDASTWVEYHSVRFGFSIRMPPLDEPPDLEREGDYLYLLSRLEGQTGPWFSIKIQPSGLSARELRNERTVARRLESRADHVTGYDPWGEPGYLGGGPETYYGRPGYGVVEVLRGPGGESGSVRTRIVLVGDRIFELQVRRRNRRPDDAIEEQFFASFRLDEGESASGETAIEAAPAE